MCAVWARRALVRQLDLQRQRKTLLSKIETIVVNFWSIVLDGEGGFGIDVFFGQCYFDLHGGGHFQLSFKAFNIDLALEMTTGHK